MGETSDRDRIETLERTVAVLEANLSNALKEVAGLREDVKALLSANANLLVQIRLITAGKKAVWSTFAMIGRVILALSAVVGIAYTATHWKP